MELTEQWKEEAKKKYGKLAKTIIGGETYVYRKLSRKEHLAIQKEVFPAGIPSDPAAIKAEDNVLVENKVFSACIVWPENVNVENVDAGVPPSLVPSILFFSGFVGSQEPEEL